MFITFCIFGIGLCLGFFAGFLVHKHEYGEISDREVFGLDKKQIEDKNT